MSMRIARTIQDVADLLSEYDVVVNLVEGDRVEFTFPPSEEEQEAIDRRSLQGMDNFSHLSDKISYTYLVRQTRHVIRGLVSSPRFWRLTTVADQLGRFVLISNGQDDKPYGVMKSRKKAQENLCIIFEDMRFAQKFMEHLKKTRLFTEIKI